MGSPIFDEMWSASGLSGARGIDTASWQGTVDWKAVAASGVSFAYVKLSEGSSDSYPTAKAQYQGATDAGLLVGPYHYAQPAISPEANADAFAAQIHRLGADAGLPPALDLEIGTGNLSGWAQRFVARLRAQTGRRRVAVYSDVSFFADQIGEGWMDDDIVLWLADYSAPPGQPRYTSRRTAIHQHSQTGRVPGVAGDVDLNVAIWPLSQLGEDMLTPEEHQMLSDVHAMIPVIQWIYGQFAGLGQDGNPAPFPQVTGWPTWAGGSNERLSLLDFGRRANTQLQQLLEDHAVNQGAGGLTAEEVSAIAAAIVAQLAEKLNGAK